MNGSGPGEPDTDEGGHQLAESDAVRGLQDVEVLKNVGNRHKSKRSHETQS